MYIYIYVHIHLYIWHSMATSPSYDLNPTEPSRHLPRRFGRAALPAARAVPLPVRRPPSPRCRGDAEVLLKWGDRDSSKPLNTQMLQGISMVISSYIWAIVVANVCK